MMTRPLFHFTLQQGWMNDPNGLVFYDGEYHLFYQHHPESTIWGAMHWGHAVSKDLLHWQEMDIALYPDALGTIFSGSALCDTHNSAGFGNDALVAIFTHHLSNTRHINHESYLQQQSLAYSLDKGRSWHKYAKNPVLSPHNKKNPDFRDPKVFWYEAKQHWGMCLAEGREIGFYRSDDLKDWQETGRFGNQGALYGVWETPELFCLPVHDSVDGSALSHWVLSVAVGDDVGGDGSRQQYFIGDFDGDTFHNANPKDTVLWADYGADFYAAQSWNNVTDRRIWVGWMNDWRYGHTIPDNGGWRGMMTLPRELSLVTRPEGIRLAQQPIAELAHLRDDGWNYPEATVSEGKHTLPVQGKYVEIALEFSPPSAGESFGLELRADDNHHLSVIYDGTSQELIVNRAQSGIVDFHDDFAQVKRAPLAHHQQTITLHIVLDYASLEVFAAEGSVVISEQFFAGEGEAIRIVSHGGARRLESFTLWQLASHTPHSTENPTE